MNELKEIDLDEIVIPYVQINAKLDFKNRVLLPQFFGGEIRSAFGRELKKVSCTRPKTDCGQCNLIEICAYGYIFESVFVKGAGKLFSPYLPHPFTLIVPPPQNYEDGVSVIEIGFKLFFNSVQFLPSVLLALKLMSENGIGRPRIPFDFVEITFSNFSKNLVKNGSIILPDEIIKTNLKLNFESNEKELVFIIQTPLRIKEKNRYIRMISPDLLTRVILRRIKLMLITYSNQILVVNEEGILNEAKNFEFTDYNIRWYDWKRFSVRQGKFMNLGGLIGSATIINLNKYATAFLKMGEEIQVGKSTSFGLGKYLIKPVL